MDTVEHTLMKHSLSDIHDYEIPKLVRRLLEFLGQTEVEKSLKTFLRLPRI